LTDDTIAAIATPPGSGALAVMRLSGPRAAAIAARVLGREPAELPPRQAVTANAHDESGPLDRVVCLFFPESNSPTGEDSVEITCHGSPYIQKRLLAAACAAGARPAGPGEFTRRTFLNGRIDLAQAEAVCDLIAAQTGLAHRAALTQLQGGLSRRIADLRRPILELLARVEAGLDHPEEDLPALPKDAAAQRLKDLARPVRDLAETFSGGRVLREGARICLVGRPNAGKSTLFNSLLGCDRAIVCDEPGTTRDVIEENWDLDGLPVVLVDTAGLGHEGGAADAQSQVRARRALETCDLALHVVDGAAHEAPLALDDCGGGILTVINKEDISACNPAGPAGGGAHRPPNNGRSIIPSAVTRSAVVAVNEVVSEANDPRADSPVGAAAVVETTAPDPHTACARKSEQGARGSERRTDCARTLTDGGPLKENTTIRVSALTGRGLPELKARIREILFPQASAAQAATVTSRRHHLALLRCADVLEGAAATPGHEGPWEELAASDLREALAAIDEITGAAAPEEVRDEIFSRFCVGK
jgi:tRNA modification GTPase